jgi:hypothetical protein
MKLEVRFIVAAITSGLVAAAVFAQTGPASVNIPANATVLEGVPAVRIDSAEGDTTRRVLDEAESAKHRLVVRIVAGEFYWTSRDNRRLRLDASGPFTYLSAEPGQYIRLTRINDKVSYVEHVDMPTGSVTWWGELRIVGGK